MVLTRWRLRLLTALAVIVFVLLAVTMGRYDWWSFLAPPPDWNVPR